MYFEKVQMACNFLWKNKWAAQTLHYLFSQSSKFVYFEKVKMGYSFKKIGRMDATLFVHPAQQIDCNSQKKKIKWTVNSEKMGWICVIFLEAEMWANRSKPTQVVVNLVNKWFWHWKLLDLHPTTGIHLQSLVFFLQHRRDHLPPSAASSSA